ncbi:hypothetical protein HDV05_003231 [Chytridiales sp. JEL 0842]|nr:hypothetical protein HDV05_003231 [Chytridiales sp. JEL 0842]
MNAQTQQSPTSRIHLSNIRTILIVSRPQVIQATIDLAVWLAYEKGKRVYIQSDMRPYLPPPPSPPSTSTSAKSSNNSSSTTNAEEKCQGTIGFWEAPGDPRNPRNPLTRHAADLLVTLGGDGTVLYASWLFQTGSPPPMVSFYMGSLGFLTVFEFGKFKEAMEGVMSGKEGVAVNVRMRLDGGIWSTRGEIGGMVGFGREVDNEPQEGEVKVVDGNEYDFGLDKLDLDKRDCVFRGHVLNEVVVDRGANPTMLTLEIL